MDQSPDDIKQQIDHTRARLDRDLNRLDTRIDEGKDNLVAASQWWFGVSAVAAGVLGAFWFWPRERRRIGFARAV
jgi:hypothetical protein